LVDTKEQIFEIDVVLIGSPPTPAETVLTRIVEPQLLIQVAMLILVVPSPCLTKKSRHHRRSLAKTGAFACSSSEHYDFSHRNSFFIAVFIWARSNAGLYKISILSRHHGSQFILKNGTGVLKIAPVWIAETVALQSHRGG
jgi:hypothetical protein